MLAVCKKELKSYFYSPIGYVFISIFMLILGIVFIITNISARSANYAGTLQTMSMFFVFIVPLLTMRSFAEERKAKTDQLFMTSPIKLYKVVLGKFLASVTVLILTLIISFIYPIILAILGEPSFGEILTAYIGFLLMGATSIAIGLLLSAITESQVVAAVSTFGVFFVMLMGSTAISFIGSGFIKNALAAISLFDRLADFTSGILGVSPIIYYLSITFTVLYTTMKLIEKRRWSGN